MDRRPWFQPEEFLKEAIVLEVGSSVGFSAL